MAEKKQPAATGTQYWGGDPQPWRDSFGKPIVDPAVIAREEGHKALAEAEDAAVDWDAEHLRARGVRVDFPVALTIALDLWE